MPLMESKRDEGLHALAGMMAEAFRRRSGLENNAPQIARAFVAEDSNNGVEIVVSFEPEYTETVRIESLLRGKPPG